SKTATNNSPSSPSDTNTTCSQDLPVTPGDISVGSTSAPSHSPSSTRTPSPPSAAPTHDVPKIRTIFVNHEPEYSPTNERKGSWPTPPASGSPHLSFS